MVERRPVKAMVPGSSPGRGAMVLFKLYILLNTSCYTRIGI